MTTDAAADARFHAFDSAHLCVLSIIAVFTTVMIVLARLRAEKVLRPLEILLAAAIVLEWPVIAVIDWREGFLNMGNALPLHLCGISAFIGAYALITRNQTACELLWFWGLGGTLQALITPDLTMDWPSPRFVLFFIVHGGIVVAALHVVAGRGIIPRSGAALRAVMWILVYAAVVGLIDAALRSLGFHANYGFLCEKPAHASLMDALGPWPWYVGSLVLLSYVLFTVLDLPFVLIRRRSMEGVSSRSPQ